MAARRKTICCVCHRILLLVSGIDDDKEKLLMLWQVEPVQGPRGTVPREQYRVNSAGNKD